jgi:hypothetical protein
MARLHGDKRATTSGAHFIMSNEFTLNHGAIVG